MKTGITLFDKSAFDSVIDGKATSIYTLDSGNGLVMQVSNFGGTIVSLWVPDRNGEYEDVVFGYDTIEKYRNAGIRYMGCAIGRYANRIANSKFELDGVISQLPANNGINCLHGGPDGFDFKVWDVVNVTTNQICLEYLSVDGEAGFPGNVKVTMLNELTPQNELRISYTATTDKPTHVNLTNHSYFNLKGAGNGTAMDHTLEVNADKYIAVDEACIPIGELESVKNTPFDFTKPTVIGERINNDDVQLKHGAGYDHCWVINQKGENEMTFAAKICEPVSGRVLEVLTDQPGIQFYSANWFDDKTIGKYGKVIRRREGLAFETQKYPDTPNRPEYPTSRLNPDETYTHECIYRFSAVS